MGEKSEAQNLKEKTQFCYFQAHMVITSREKFILRGMLQNFLTKQTI